MERRTVPGETVQIVCRELDEILVNLRAADPSFEAETRLVFSREPYELPQGHPIAKAARDAARRITGRPATVGGMSFWTDAAVLGGAGIPSVLFGPGGAGLHSIEEYVVVEDVLTCRDVLVELSRTWCENKT
jgi:acetylornithine deacetylase